MGQTSTAALESFELALSAQSWGATHWGQWGEGTDLSVQAGVRRHDQQGLGALAGEPQGEMVGRPISYQKLVKRAGVEFLPRSALQH